MEAAKQASTASLLPHPFSAAGRGCAQLLLVDDCFAICSGILITQELGIQFLTNQDYFFIAMTFRLIKMLLISILLTLKTLMRPVVLWMFLYLKVYFRTFVGIRTLRFALKLTKSYNSFGAYIHQYIRVRNVDR